MVVCQRCGRRPAVIQSQQIGPDGRPIFVNLCEVCFQEIREEASKTSFLDKYGRDLTALAREDRLDPVIGRKSEIERVVHILSRRTKNNPVLIGDPGVGKTAIVEGLAQKIVQGAVPETLKGKRVVSIDLPLMLAGASHRGEFEQRLKKTIEEVINAKGQIILFIDELHTVIGAGAAEGAIDAANMLKPALARGELQAIGATTLDEYRQHVERDAALERRFQPVLIAEPTLNDTIEILKGLRPKYEKHHQVKIDDGAVVAAVELSDRYIADRFLPDKAIDLIDEACAKVRLAAVKEPENLKRVEEELQQTKASQVRTQKTAEKDKLQRRIDELEKVRAELTDLWLKTKMEEVPVVRKENIAEIVSGMTGIPLSDLSEEEMHKLLKLEERLHERIVDQNEAVKVVAEAIRRSRVGLKDPRRPIGSFLFLGPTGVGKTELTKALAEVLYGSEDLMVRLDMSEYMERHTVSRLIGAPPGYIGFERGGQLTEIVRRKPFSVILLDEIEKAHPEVFNVLLQIMEDGRLTDGHGRTVDFKNVIIIMTSNVGSELLSKESIGFSSGGGEVRNPENDSYQKLKDKVMAALKQTFRPEFLNRIDEIVVFHPLGRKEVRQIAERILEQTANLLSQKGIILTVSEKAKDYLVKEGFDPDFGARPLRRLIQKEVENLISSKMLTQEIGPGKKILVDAGKKGLQLSVLSK
ncbi:MAG: AAA family ATPase [Patescibacteria group bacterium]|nr:AAA family ATPase [Patescibacteria group bacterium]